jgi:hypothetical protein
VTVSSVVEMKYIFFQNKELNPAHCVMYTSCDGTNMNHVCQLYLKAQSLSDLPPDTFLHALSTRQDQSTHTIKQNGIDKKVRDKRWQ